MPIEDSLLGLVDKHQHGRLFEGRQAIFWMTLPASKLSAWVIMDRTGAVLG